MFVHFFFLHENRDCHIAGRLDAKPEELGKICPNSKRCAILRSTVFYSKKFSVGATVKAL